MTSEASLHSSFGLFRTDALGLQSTGQLKSENTHRLSAISLSGSMEWTVIGRNERKNSRCTTRKQDYFELTNIFSTLHL